MPVHKSSFHRLLTTNLCIFGPYLLVVVAIILQGVASSSYSLTTRKFKPNYLYQLNFEVSGDALPQVTAASTNKSNTTTAVGADQLNATALATLADSGVSNISVGIWGFCVNDEVCMKHVGRKHFGTTDNASSSIEGLSMAYAVLHPIATVMTGLALGIFLVRQINCGRGKMPIVSLGWHVLLPIATIFAMCNFIHNVVFVNNVVKHHWMVATISVGPVAWLTGTGFVCLLLAIIFILFRHYWARLLDAEAALATYAANANTYNNYAEGKSTTAHTEYAPYSEAAPRDSTHPPVTGNPDLVGPVAATGYPIYSSLTAENLQSSGQHLQQYPV